MQLVRSTHCCSGRLWWYLWRRSYDTYWLLSFPNLRLRAVVSFSMYADCHSPYSAFFRYHNFILRHALVLYLAILLCSIKSIEDDDPIQAYVWFTVIDTFSLVRLVLLGMMYLCNHTLVYRLGRRFVRRSWADISYYLTQTLFCSPLWWQPSAKREGFLGKHQRWAFLDSIWGVNTASSSLTVSLCVFCV